MSFRFTHKHKVAALSNRFYNDAVWIPKRGDFYTVCRDGLELFEIVYEDKNYLKFNKVFPTFYEFPDRWKRTTFATEGFGKRRVHVPTMIMEDIKRVDTTKKPRT